MHAPFSVEQIQAAYDHLVRHVPERIATDLSAKPLDLAMFDAFTTLVLRDGGGAVADIGCGLGQVTAHLGARGLDAFGVDLTPAMLAVARRSYPHIRFEEGSMLDLDLPDGQLAGVVAVYSIIHLRSQQVPQALMELGRVLRPGGYLLLAFQVGDGPQQVERDVAGTVVTLDYHRWQPDRVEDLLGEVGLPVQARLVREPDPTERLPQAYILAQRPR